MDEDGTAAAAAKQRWRADLLAARRARPADELARARAEVCARVLERAAGIECVAGYLPMRTEPGSVELLTALHELGARVLVPVTRPDRDLDWTAWTPTSAGPALGVDAIGVAGLVLLPALAVAADGTRLGRGGGSYDRALARCRPGTALVALLFEGELVDRLPRDPWDRAVTAVVTPGGWTDLGRNTDVAQHR